jgi:hypothetical protein
MTWIRVKPLINTKSVTGSPDRDYPGTKHETTWLGFAREGGICPCVVLWRGTCPCWLSPKHGDPYSTQILPRHYGAKSQIIIQLTNVRTMSTRQVPNQFSPSGLSKHLRMGSVYTSHILLTTWMDSVLHKLSAQTKIVHMELNLRLSFQLSHSLGGYMVGSTMRFRVMTMDALTPWPHHRILWRYL